MTNGVYQGAPHPAQGLNRMALTDQIQVQSLSGPRLTRIEGADGVRCAYIGEGCTLSGFTLTGGYAEEGGGAYCEPTGVLTNCILTANTAAWGGGGVRGGILYNCLLSGNVAGWEGGGAAYCTLYHCSLTGEPGRMGMRGQWLHTHQQHRLWQYCTRLGRPGQLGGVRVRVLLYQPAARRSRQRGGRSAFPEPLRR
ncbi:MAG: hypothetical protein M5U12_32245 [Verrucomicrobia bacterium]|nr:hypothetical protein [Verrucomicrobiota bacterium]